MVVEIQSLSHLKQFTSDPTKIVVIDFYATWCGPCVQVAPHYTKLADTFTATYGGPSANNGASVVFMKCNVDACRDVASFYNVKSMPTFIIIQEGKEIDRVSGANGLGRVERVAKDNLAYVSMRLKDTNANTNTTTASQQVRSPPTASSSSVSSPSKPLGEGVLLNAPARHLTKISAAIAGAGGDTTKAMSSGTDGEKAALALLTYLKSQTGSQESLPLGVPLIPFLLCDEYSKVPHEPFDAFLKTLIAVGSNAHQGGGDVVCENGVCSIVPPSSSSADLSTLFTKSFTEAEEAVAIIVNICRVALNALTFESWPVVGAGGITAHTVPNPMEQQMALMMRSANTAGAQARNRPPPPAPYNGQWHTLIHRMLKCETVLKVLFSPSSSSSRSEQEASILSRLVADMARLATPSPLILSRWTKTGKQLEINSLFGSLLSPGLFPARASLHQQQIQMVAMLNPTGLKASQNDVRAVRAEVETNLSSVRGQIHLAMDEHVRRCFPIFRELLGKKGAVRTHMLRWFHAFFAANAGFTRQNREKSELCSETAMLTLSHVLVDLALPIIEKRNFEADIPTDYYHDLNAFAVELPNSSAKRNESDETESEETLVKIEKELLTALNTRSLVHFGLNRKDVERVSHFIPLEEAALEDPERVAAIIASSAATAASVDRKSNNGGTRGADDDDNTNDGVAGAQPADEEETLPLPAIGKSTTNSSSGDALGDAFLNTQGVNHYPPRVHIFYLALRAISLSQTTLLESLRHLEQQLNHPRVAPREKAFLFCLQGTQKALLTNDIYVRKTVQFLNGAARWLLHILGADIATGELPKEVPRAWRLMPQTIINEVLTALTLVTKHQVSSLKPSDVDDIISLFLVLMGNLTYFPKAHTHALFPEMILALLNSPFAAALVRHRWYNSNIVLGCVRTYIAMEKCYYDKTNCRYYLSVCLKQFLAQDQLCYPARAALLDQSTRTLERFTHMVTTEANQAIDEVLSCLAQMRVLEAEGKDIVASDGSDRTAGFNNNATAAARRRRRNNNNNNNRQNDEALYDDTDDDDEDGEEDEHDNAGGAAPTATNNNVRTESYPQLGERLKNALLLFKETIAVFKLLSRQFQAGVLQHMVAQQISNMLVQNISKLAGKNSAELKVKNPEMWGFKPREILEALVDCFVGFAGEDVFTKCVLESMHSVTTPEIFTYALSNITNPSRRLVVPSLAEQLDEMNRTINAANVGRRIEEQIWDEDAPDWALCAIMATPLKDPVVLPMPASHGGVSDDLTFVERDVIRHRLLELEENPFSRQRLTEEQLNAYNNEPAIKKAVAELKARIAAFVAEKRAQLLQQ